MYPFKTLIPATLITALVIILKDLISCSVGSFHSDNRRPASFIRGNDVAKNQSGSRSIYLDSVHRAASIYDEHGNENDGKRFELDEASFERLKERFNSFKAELVTPGNNLNYQFENSSPVHDSSSKVTPADLSGNFRELVKKRNSYKPNNAEIACAGSNERPRDRVLGDIAVSDFKSPHHDGTLLNTQGPMSPTYPGQSFKNKGTEHHLSNSFKENHASRALEAKKEPQRLARIYDLDAAVMRRVERDYRYRKLGRPLLRQQHVSKTRCGFEAFSFSRCTLYSTLGKGSRWGVYGRAVNLGLHGRITKSIITLFEMHSNLDTLPRYNSASMLELNKVRAKFNNAKWSIHIGIPKESKRIGRFSIVKAGDPSPTMTLWQVTSDGAEKITLSIEDKLAELFLREGDLIVAIPTQFDGIMEAIKEKKSYDVFARFIKEHAEGFDQLLLVLEI